MDRQTDGLTDGQQRERERERERESCLRYKFRIVQKLTICQCVVTVDE